MTFVSVRHKKFNKTPPQSECPEMYTMPKLNKIKLVENFLIHQTQNRLKHWGISEKNLGELDL